MNRRAPLRWLNICFFSLAIVAFLGVVMRYKIAFSLPFIDQKNILHAHSHFAFAGWISQALMVLLINYLASKTLTDVFKKYNTVLWANLIVAYGMMISLGIVGYKHISIVFSTLSLFVSYIFAYMYWKDLDRTGVRSAAHLWFKAALVFNIISSLGPFSLAYIMVNNLTNTKFYLASVYYYLHFQYNGWFFFGCAGLLSTQLFALRINNKIERTVFWLFALACIPAYFLSALWLKIPVFVYVLVVIGAIAQCVAWILWVREMHTHKLVLLHAVGKASKWIFMLAAIALSIKLLLQLGSTIPTLSHIAFGFRPIVIGYLHLVLLGVITLFLLGYTRFLDFHQNNKIASNGINIFVAGVILNEAVLMVQGIGAMSYNSVPYTNELLFLVALTLLGGMVVFNIGQRTNNAVSTSTGR